MKNRIEVSMCCKADLMEDFINNPTDHHNPIEIYTCEKCKQECEADLIDMEVKGEMSSRTLVDTKYEGRDKISTYWLSEAQQEVKVRSWYVPFGEDDVTQEWEIISINGIEE